VAVNGGRRREPHWVPVATEQKTSVALHFTAARSGRGVSGIAIWRLPGSASDDQSPGLLGRRRCVLGQRPSSLTSSLASRLSLRTRWWSPTNGLIGSGRLYGGTERREGVTRFGSESKATRVAPGGKHLPQVLAKRAETLDAAYATNPAQFQRRPPEPPKLPTVAWINEPHRSRVDSVKSKRLKRLDRFSLRRRGLSG
jgi:hypothetical protein